MRICLRDEACRAEVKPDDAGVALLHQRHHRRPEGGGAHAPQPAVPDAGLLRRHRPARPERRALHPAPLSHGSGLLRPAALRGRRGATSVPESGQFDPAEIFELLEHWPDASFFAAPTMIVRLLASRRARAPPKGLQTHHLRRRADVRRRLPARHRAFRPALVPALRPGRGADDDHRSAANAVTEGLHRRSSLPAALRAPVSR